MLLCLSISDPAVFDTEEPSIPRHSPPHHNLSVPDALCEDAHNVDHNAITATTTDPLMTVTSAISGSVPVSWLTSSVGHYTSDNVPSSAANISHNGRGMPAVWPPQHPPLLMGAYPRPTGHHVQYPEGHIGYGGQNAALFGNPPRSPFTSAGSSATVPQSYPPVHGGGPSLGNAGSYPSATLPFFQAQPAPSQVGLIMAAMQQNAPPNQTIAQANPQQVANQLFAAVAAAAHPNPFAAALAAAAQQQQQACYHHASTLHTNQLQRPAGPLLYYANQPLPLSLQRHSGRMPQATMYPNAQPYQGVHPTNLFPHQSSHSDLLGRLDIPPHGHSFSGGVPHTSNVHYPVLLSNPLQFPQGSANPGISDLTTGLSGLHIHYGRSRPSFSQPMGVNLAGNVPISVATTVPPTATVSDMPKFSSEPENNDASTDGYPTTDGSTGEDPSESAQSTVVYCNLTMTANNNDEGESGEAVATDHPAATSGQAVDDSEESTSSGIGEMNSGCSSNTGDIASRMPSTDGALNINVEPSLAASTTNTPEPDP